MLEADVTSALSRTPLFEEFGEEIHNRLAADCPIIDLEKGELLCEQGEPSTMVYILLSGSLDIVVTSAAKKRIKVDRVAAPNLVGEMQLLSGTQRSASLIACSPCELLSISRSTVLGLFTTHPSVLKHFADMVRTRSRHNRFVEMLPRLTGSDDSKMLSDLESESRWRSLERGQSLFREGEPATSMFVVMTGRLQVSVEVKNVSRLIGEVSAGECLGEMAVLGSTNRSETVTALRFTELIEISKERFEKLSANYPALVMGISRLLNERLRRTTVSTNGSGHGIRTIAVLPAGSNASIESFCKSLTTALEAHGTTRHLYPDQFSEDLGGEQLARTPKEDPQCVRLTSVLDELEELSRFVIYESEPGTSQWTQHCIERADLILLVGSSTAAPTMSNCEEWLKRMDDNAAVRAQRFLVLRHPAGTKLPKGTSQWLKARNVDLHLHCLDGQDGDIRRVARYVAGRAVGIVLGGGGARGLAHIGVFKALLESGVPIDMVGGTSSGGMVGGSYAQGLSVQEMVDDARSVFLGIRPLNSYTVPFLSLLDPRKLDHATQRSFGGIDIADLWIPYFCISCNLTRGTKVVHQHGSLWRAIRATTSLPGVAVPLVEDGDLLVDGGVIENVPVKTMRSLKAGPNIVVDVSRPDAELTVDCSYEELPSGWSLLWNRLNPFSANRKLFNIMQVISRVATVNSVREREETREMADLTIEPPVSDFGMLEWEAIDQLVDLAYRTALEKLKDPEVRTTLDLDLVSATSDYPDRYDLQPTSEVDSRVSRL